MNRKESVELFVRELTEDIVSLEDILEALIELEPDTLEVSEDQLYMKLGAQAATVLGTFWNVYCETAGAENFVTIDLRREGLPHGITVTVQRHPGKTPTEIIEQLRHKIALLEGEIARNNIYPRYTIDQAAWEVTCKDLREEYEW
jgi:hypothetical protein